MSLYYANGGPGPATDLLRVDAPPDGTREQWWRAPAYRWTERDGWGPETLPSGDAQGMITQLGEYFMIDESRVATVQQEIRDY